MKKYLPIFVVVIVVFSAIVFLQVFNSGNSAPLSVPKDDGPRVVQSPVAGTMETQIIPRGPQTYNVSEAAGRLPHIVRVTVDSPDVPLGGTQKFSITVEDDANISSVVVRTTLDDSEVDTLLAPVGPAPALSGMRTFEYGGSWVVSGACDIKYSTQFIVTDSKGRVNSVRLLWRGI